MGIRPCRGGREAVDPVIERHTVGFRITFAERFFVGPQIDFRHLEGQFEVWTLGENLLAFGDFDAPPPWAPR